MPRRAALALVTLATVVATVSLAAPAQASHTFPPSTPAAPTGTAGDGQVSVAWSAPPSLNPITSYTVRAYAASTLVSTSTVNGSPPATSTTVAGLTNGSAYTFTVTATQLFGMSSGESAASDPVTPAGPPGAPQSVAATGGVASVTVTWQPPLSTGGAAVTGYLVELTPGGGTCSGGASDTSCEVTALTNGTTYTATVRATNAAGTGSASSGASATPLPVPPAPVALTSSGTGTAVQSATVVVPAGHSVTFLDGGSPVTTLTVAGQGSFAVGPGGDTLTFTPAAGFVGTATPATYALMDGFAQQGTSTYTPTVYAAPPAPVPPDPVTTPPTVQVTVPAPVLALAGRTGAVPVNCLSSAGTVRGCTVTLSTSVGGRLVRVGSGTDAQGSVDVRLTRRGWDLVHRAGGRALSVQAAIAVDGATPIPASTTVTVVPTRVALGRSVHFQPGSKGVDRAATRYLRSVRGRLDGVRRVTCLGYTDDRGAASYNAALSKRRARAVCNLVTAGLDVRVSAHGRGESHPVATNATAAGRAANRRVVVVLHY